MQLQFEKEKKEPEIKARLISKYDDAYCPDNVTGPIVVSDVATIAEGISRDLTDYHATLIESPPGFGKTWFILHEILPRVRETGGKLLLVSNRIAVSYQQKIEVLKALNGDELEDYTEKGLLKKTDFGENDDNPDMVKILTLQALEPFLRSPKGIAYSKEVSVLCVDEVQYFTSDYFCPSAARLLERLPQIFNHAVRVYLSATPEDVLVPLSEAEQAAQRPIMERMGITPSPLCWGERPSITWYRFVDNRYCDLPIRYYREESELLDQIESSGQDGWLIFVQTKSSGEALVEKLGDEAVFISADKKGTKAWNELLRKEKLPCRILVTTSVIDCGVNIQDENLKHVVVPYEDHAMFIQALGRKRFKGEPKFTLYVRAISKKRLKDLIYQNERLLDFADQIEHSASCNWALEKLLNDGTPAERSLLSRGNDNRWGPNAPYVHKLHRQRYFYQQLQKLFELYGDSAFPHLVHQWLGQSSAYDEHNWLGYDVAKEGIQALLAFLGEYNGRLLSTESEQRMFSITLHRYYKSITGDRRNDNRGDGYKKTSALNTCLKKLGINGEVKSKGPDSGWVFNMVAGGGIKEPSEEND